MDNAYLTSTIEALILASPDPLPVRKITQVLDDATPSRVAKAVADLNGRYVSAGLSFRLRELAGGYQFYILPEYVGYVEELFSRQRKLRLTRAALETVAIVAYRQPVTKAEIEHVRGVASDGVLHNLLNKQLVTIRGRANTAGKPLQYGTTDEFLKFFGLNSLDDLPKMSEIEELISASEPQSQTELELLQVADEGSEKLNIADGTFDPETRKRLDDDGESAEEEPASTSVNRLVLKEHAAEETQLAGEETPDNNSSVCVESEPVSGGGND